MFYFKIGPKQKTQRTFRSSAAVQGEEVWLRKAANVKEENLMAFQGR